MGFESYTKQSKLKLSKPETQAAFQTTRCARFPVNCLIPTSDALRMCLVQMPT